MDTRFTKEKIIDAAAELFSSRGYNNISVRDIANRVGIKAASLYNHFPSKRDILLSIYDYFTEQRLKFAPTLEELLSRIETEHPHKVLMRLNYSFPPDLFVKMEQALLIANRELSFNNDSERFIRDFLYEPTALILVPVLNRMIELGKIEPLDVDCFCLILMHFALSSAVLSCTTMRGNEKNWKNGLTMIFSLVKPVEKPRARARLNPDSSGPD